MGKAVLFSGQGAQTPGMFTDMYDKYEKVREVFDRASKIVGFDIEDMCRNGSIEKLSETEICQPVTLACDIAAWELLKEKGFKPDHVAGFSLGEYGALYAAGVLSFEDVFRLIRVRANAMAGALPKGQGAMAVVVFSDPQPVEQYFEDCKYNVSIANYNTKGQYTISGLAPDLESVEKELKERGIMVKRIPTSSAFHTKYMLPATEPLSDEMSKCSFRKPQIPIIMNYDGSNTEDVEEIQKKALLQTSNPVQWIKTLEYLNSQDVSEYYECGPGRTLTGFVKKMRFENVTLININRADNID